MSERIYNDGITLRAAVLSDAEAIHDLMERVHADMEDKTLFFCDDLAYVKRQLSGDGFGVVAENEEGLMAAAFVFAYPGLGKENLGRDLGFSDEQLLRVVHMETTIVLREFRGHHLQERMLLFGENMIDRKKHNIFLATVSPDNPASYRTIEKQGYKVMLTKEKYGGLLRRIYCKEVAPNKGEKMRARLHHICICITEFDWYLNFFQEVFGMTVERTAKEPPRRQLWFHQGIQLKEVTEPETLGTSTDHISIGVDDIPATVAHAVSLGCSSLPNGEHWFALPDGVKVELKPFE